MTFLLNRNFRSFKLFRKFESATESILCCANSRRKSGVPYRKDTPSQPRREAPVVKTQPKLNPMGLPYSEPTKAADTSSLKSGDNQKPNSGTLKEFSDVSRLIGGKSFQPLKNFDEVKIEVAGRILIKGIDYAKFHADLHAVNILMSEVVQSLKDESNQTKMFADRNDGNVVVGIFKGTNAIIQNLAQWNSVLEKVASDRLSWIRTSNFDKHGAKPRVLKEGDTFTADGNKTFTIVGGIPVEAQQPKA